MRHLYRLSVGFGLFLSGLGWLISPLLALEPPTPEEVSRYQAEGSMARHLAAARALGNDRIEPWLAARVSARLRALASPGHDPYGGISPRILPPAQESMPTHGVVRVLAVLIAFPEYPPFNTAGLIEGRLFGNGPGTYPYESVRNYYRRSSYNQLEIQGQALGWYTTAYPRSAVTQTTAGRENLIKEALLAYDAQGVDFAPYDNDGDGAIDYLIVIWTGPHQEWADFWWGYKTNFADSGFTLDGKRLDAYSWQWESRNYPAAFTTNTVIHETGHALGLPDYYDYDASIGPPGGVGGLDQMDNANGDHNCFSKFMLDWLTPAFFSATNQRLTLRPAGSFPDAILVMPEVEPGTTFAEYFMIQNRWRAGNDVPYPNDGLLIWHVDARLDDWGNTFQYNNSYTDHKLLRLMEADGREDIEARWPADAGDYYTPGHFFGPYNHPSSDRYDGTRSGIVVTNTVYSGSSILLDLYNLYAADTTPPVGAPSRPELGGASIQTPYLDLGWSAGTSTDPESGIVGYYLEIRSVDGQATVFAAQAGNTTSERFLNIVDGATYQARVRAVNGRGMAGAWSAESDPATVALPPVCLALDHCGLAWTGGGLAPWFTETELVPPMGGTAARSGTIPGGADTWLSTTVTGPGHLSFYWKVSCELDFDFLAFQVDGGEMDKITGEVDWQWRAFDLPPGTHSLSWRYQKDLGVQEGTDAGWLDAVVYYRFRGDLDLSGRLDALDLAALAHYLVGNLEPGEAPLLASLEAADLDESGAVDAADLIALRSLLVENAAAHSPVTANTRCGSD